MSEPPPLDSNATVEDVGSILHDYIKGDYKLSMWIPEELGKTDDSTFGSSD